ncbi:MAG: 5'-methylthioadenosine/S-adenosylhomocysteine nucleosidase [Bacteriovoracaceae bacterium]|nr:5'-methylthioadenosine/S-adenosylhomocysteine nucleosidase [Bacteriovoracaceae bacterium]
MCTLLVSPLKGELTPILNYFKSKKLKIENIKIKYLNVSYIPQLKLYCAIGGHGKVQFGIQTSFLISTLKNVSQVICAGSCGSLCTTVDVFDVVVASQTVEHDYNEKFDKDALNPSFVGNTELLGKAKLFQHPNFKVHLGKIASGDEDIVDAQRADQLYQDTNALVVAWEGAGGARASRFHQIPFLEVRAITDNARDEVPSSFAKNLSQAMNNCAFVIEHLLEEVR